MKSLNNKIFTLKNLLLVSFLPIVEVFFLQYITVPNYVMDLNYLIVQFVCFYILLAYLDKANNLNFQSNPKIVFLNLSFLLTYTMVILIIYAYPYIGAIIYVRFFLMLSSVAIIFTSLISFLQLDFFLKHNLKFWTLAPLSFSVTAYPMLNSILWSHLSSSTCIIVSRGLALFGYSDVFLVGGYTLKSPYFSISIFPACSGLEGILIFVTVFSIFLIQSNLIFLKTKYIFFTYLIGIFYMYVLNILRIISYFLFGMSVAKTSGSVEGAKSAIKLFHSNVGWVLYFIGISLFIYIWVYFSKKLKNSSLDKT